MGAVLMTSFDVRGAVGSSDRVSFRIVAISDRKSVRFRVGAVLEGATYE